MVGHSHRQSSSNGSFTSISITSQHKLFSHIDSAQVLMPIPSDHQWNEVLQPTEQINSYELSQVQCTIGQSVPAHQHAPNIEQSFPAHQHSPNIRSSFVGQYRNAQVIELLSSGSNGLPSSSVIDGQATSENMVMSANGIHEIYQARHGHSSHSEMDAMLQGGNRRTTTASSSHSDPIPPPLPHIGIFKVNSSFNLDMDTPNMEITIDADQMMKEEPGSSVNYSNQEPFNCGSQFANESVLNTSDHILDATALQHMLNNQSEFVDQRDGFQVNQPADYFPENYPYTLQPSRSGNEYSIRAVEDSKQSGEFQQPANSATSHSLNCLQKSFKRRRTEQPHDSLENNSKYEYRVSDSHTRKKKPSNSKKEKKPPSEVQEKFKNPKCGHCLQGFNSASELRDHFRTTSCGELYSQKFSQVNFENRVYICGAHNCKFATLHLEVINDHSKEHTDKKDSLSGSKPNGKRSQDSTTKGNSRIRHAPEVIRCDICGYQCAFEKTFWKHIDKHVNNEIIDKLFNCFMCGEDHATQAEATECEKSHMVNGKYKCPFCDCFSSPQRKKMIQHMRSHYGERCHKCDICEYDVNRRDNLMTHRNHNHRDMMNNNASSFCPRVLLLFKYQNICIILNKYAKLNLRGKVVVVKNDFDLIRCLFEEAGMSEREFLESNPHYRPRTNALDQYQYHSLEEVPIHHLIDYPRDFPHEILTRNENIVTTSVVYGHL